MKLKYFLIFFVLISSIVIAQEGAYDCDDNPDDDPSICQQGTIDCDNPIYLVCAECIFSGQTEICYDEVDNNCNVDEGYQFDLDPNTGKDAKDISCCDITGVSWRDVDLEVFEDKSSIAEGTAVKIRVNGSSGCQDQDFTIEILEDDGILGYDYLLENLTGTFGTADTKGQTFATVTWTTSWTKDAFDIINFNNDPEYIAKAYAPDSIATEYDLSQTIQVYQAATGCEIEDAKWSTNYPTNYMKDSENVELVVDTLGLSCEGLTINFELYENDGFIGDDFLGSIGLEFQPDSVTIGSSSPTKQTWTAIYDLTNDDNDIEKGTYKDLEYYFKAKIGSKEQKSDIAKIRMCDPNDQDCDTICDPGKTGKYCNPGKDGEGDKCPDTPFGEEVDNTGCSGDQRNCLAYWDCSAVEWEDHCDDEPPVWTRNIGDCTDMTGNPGACYCTYDTGGSTACEGLGIIPTTTKGCMISESFPVFTGFNVFLVIVLLSFYYIFKNDKTKKA